MARNIPSPEVIEKMNLDHFLEKDIDLSHYIKKQELEAMTTQQQTRLKNIAQNYEIMLYMGLPAIKPDFMKKRNMAEKQIELKPKPKPKRKLFKEAKDDSDTDSDITWTPDLENGKNNEKIYPAVVPRKKNRTEDGPLRKRARTCRKTNDKKFEKRIYQLREKRAASYMHLEPPDDDDYLFCEDCNKEYDTDCPIHGPLNYIRDVEVPKKTDPDRALHTLPSGLVVKESSIAGAGLGVFTEQEILPRVMFGPYGGVKTHDAVLAHDSGYCWQIYTDGKPSHFVDAKDKAKSNWMRYVNCATSESEQNLVAFQFKGEIYYRSYKPITPGTELLCWYGNEYGRELGLVRDKNLLIRPELVMGEECYPCVFCKTGFTTALYNVKHLLRMHGSRLKQSDIQVLDEWLRKNDWDNYTRRSQNKSQKCYNNEEIFNRTKADIEQKGDKLISKDINNNKIDNYHVENKHNTSNEILQKINKCKDVNASSDSLKNHETSIACDKRFKCTVCSYACNQNIHLKTHMMIHTGEKPFKCTVCSFACNNSGSLKTHMMIHTGDKPFKCTVCSYTCNTNGHLKTHMMIHTEEKPFKCTVCSYACNYSSNLKKHMMKHTGEKPFKCTVCSYACNYSGHLKTHMMIHTGEKPFKCTVCSFACNQNIHLKNHMMIHTGEKPFKCTVCSYACNHSSSLKTHMLIHTGEKPFKCTVCSYACNNSGHLKRHMRIHTEEKPFKCTVCSYACNHSSSLKTHMLIHTGEKPFKCTVCSYACNNSGHLKRHMRIHTGEKPFKCTVCSYACNNSGHLKTHMRIHTEEKPFKCTVCSYASNQSINLRTHMRIHDKNN